MAHLILFIMMVKSPLIKITNSILHFPHFRNLFDTASVEKVVYFYSSPLFSFVIYFVIPCLPAGRFVVQYFNFYHKVALRVSLRVTKDFFNSPV